MMKRALIIILLMGLPLTANAQDADMGVTFPLPQAPECTAKLEGQITCQSNRMCECVHKSAVPARNLPDRWAWDCGIQRQSCDVSPASPGVEADILPPVIVDKSGRDDERHDRRRGSDAKKGADDPPF